MQKINCILAVLLERKIDGGHCVKFKNKYYLPKTDIGDPVHFKKKTTCMVIEAFDGNLYGNILDTIYVLEEVPSHHNTSANV